MVFTSVSGEISFARLRPIENSPPPSPPRPPIMDREAHIQMPTNNSGGMIHDSRVANALLPGVPLYSTPCFASWLARFGGTCTVLNSVLPSGIFSVSVPRITSPDTVTFFTLPASRYCWNWLYGSTATPLPLLSAENSPHTPTASRPKKSIQIIEGSCGFCTGIPELLIWRWHA